MAKPQIIGISLSSYVRTARMAAIEKGVDHDHDPAPPGDAAVTAIHPFGKVPVFRHGAVELFETRAITQYLDTVFDGPALQPTDPVERARMEQWISTINDVIYGTWIRNYVLQYAFPSGADGLPDRAVIEAALPDIEYQLAVFNRALTDNPYLVGGQLSLADLFLLPLVFYVNAMPEGKDRMSAAPHVQRFLDHMGRRESFQATLPPTN